MGEIRFVELLNSKLKKNFWWKRLQFRMYIKLLDLDGLKCELKSVYAVDLAKQALNIQEVADIIREL